MVREATTAEQLLEDIDVHIGKTYPLVLRRLRVAASKQQSNQLFSDFLQMIKNMEISFEIQRMKPEDFVVCVVLNPCKDATLRLKLLELPQPLTVQPITDKILSYEAQVHLNRGLSTGGRLTRLTLPPLPGHLLPLRPLMEGDGDHPRGEGGGDEEDQEGEAPGHPGLGQLLMETHHLPPRLQGRVTSA